MSIELEFKILKAPPLLKMNASEVYTLSIIIFSFIFQSKTNAPSFRVDDLARPNTTFLKLQSANSTYQAF